MAAKSWKRHVTFQADDEKGWILVVSTPSGGNPSGRNDPDDSITIEVNNDLPATIEYSLQGFGGAKFVGPDPDSNGNASMIWDATSPTLTYSVSANGRSLTVTDNNSTAGTNYAYQLGAYGPSDVWRESEDPQIHNVEEG